jgi:hypothetical protein
MVQPYKSWNLSQIQIQFNIEQIETYNYVWCLNLPFYETSTLRHRAKMQW